MKRSVVLILVAAVLVLTLALAFAACDPKGGSDQFVRADGKILLGNDGKPVALMGTNFGGWLVQESWLVPTEIGKVYGHIDMLLELANRFGKDRADELLAIYEDNWVTEQDFEFVKNLGMNCIRLPFTYLTLYEGVMLDEATNKYVRTPFKDLTLKKDAFKRLDWAVEMCKKYGLYLILDMHGAVGSQSGNDHTGDILYPNFGQLWLNDETGETCRAKTKELWVAIAEHYKDEKCIAFYDLMNEPGIKDASGGQITDERTWVYFDELYKAIREVDPNHAISMESCWEVGGLPDPAMYGWENVVYQYHHYNWTRNYMGFSDNKFFYGFKVQGLKSVNVPIFIGEFNVWGDDGRDKKYTQTEEEAWAGVMELYAGYGWHFTTWNFKHAATHSSWGLLNLNEDHTQANYMTDDFDTIAAAWRAGNSSNYHENTSLTNCIKPYLSTFNVMRDEPTKKFAILS